MNPKTSDFGMVHIFTHNELEASRVVGTCFYNEDQVLITIVGYAWELWKDGHGLEIMDPKLSDLCMKGQFLSCIHVGLLYVEENAVDRPNYLMSYLF
ncbi:putative non-specific serine/threonine protein kinase [Rosa chinensis]|uniref:Putative non-specific serine/threonine protein kinase n=1 Tax=Rosa chinensis TaxID=74649 RepID=A0A2P6Q8H3_ROSCH|nr:putative non-specific serine/threonine protein kinase [Rosa chinensis]